MGDLLEYGRQRVVVITGADRGLGLALVQEYLKRGDRVFAGKYGKNWHLLEKLKESFPDALSIVDLDVRSNESVAKAADFLSITPPSGKSRIQEPYWKTRWIMKR